MPVTDDVALPVQLSLPGALGAQVRDHVEGTLGWQVVDGGALPARVRLVSPELVGSPASAPVPTVVVVADGAAVASVTALVTRVDGVVAWPTQAARLPEVVDAALASRAAHRVTRAPLVVGGAAGGVGTSTVALAVAGLRAWRGARTLVVTGGRSPVPEALELAASALAASGLWAAASPVPGVPRLRAVRLTGAHDAAARTDEVDAVVDAGVDDDVDVLVLRRDRPGIEAMARSRAAAFVVLDDGIAPRRAVVRAAEGRPVLPVPTSVRVARAHAARRVPAALPGSWLAALEGLVDEA